jgi:CheY-like chemotaxis protein
VTLDLTELIKSTNQIVDQVFDKNIRIHLDLEEGLYVKGNKSFLSQVFMNLYTNARDAMPDGGYLEATAKAINEKVVVTVRDTGYGMDKKTQERIFDPFFTLKEVGKGTGLGLSTTHGIIAQHGGTIHVFSEPGAGTTFKIELPLALDEIEPEQKPIGTVSPGSGQKVLIVDDEPPALDALTHLTTSLGYQPLSYDSPNDALKEYSQLSPDIVLMDRNMPEMDGITCIRKIVEGDPDAKIIIISGYEASGPDGIEQDIRGKIKGYLTKPCGREELGRILSQALVE